MDPALDLVLERGTKPLHVTIAEQLAAAIASGALAPGERLPPERHLAESLGVSRMTVRQALAGSECARRDRGRELLGDRDVQRLSLIHI